MLQINTENISDQLKEILESYSFWVDQERKLENKKALYIDQRVSISINMDGMPHASGTSGLEEYVAKVEGMDEDLAYIRDRKSAAKLQILRLISGLDSQIEQDLMKYRYIFLFSWTELLKVLKRQDGKQGHYTKDRIYQIHRECLEKMEKIYQIAVDST